MGQDLDECQVDGSQPCHHVESSGEIPETNKHGGEVEGKREGGREGGALSETALLPSLISVNLSHPCGMIVWTANLVD